MVFSVLLNIIVMSLKSDITFYSSGSVTKKKKNEMPVKIISKYTTFPFILDQTNSILLISILLKG